MVKQKTQVQPAFFYLLSIFCMSVYYKKTLAVYFHINRCHRYIIPVRFWKAHTLWAEDCLTNGNVFASNTNSTWLNTGNWTYPVLLDTSRL